MPESVTYFCPQCLTRQPTFEYWNGAQLLVRCQACGAAVEEGLIAEGEIAFRPRPILFIDDDPLLLRLVSRLLTAHHFRPLLESDGATGLATACRERPALILLDVLMPGLDGYAVCRALRADPALQETPIILLTAKKDPLLRAKGFKAGATLAIEKPVDPTALIVTINTALALKPKAVTPSPADAGSGAPGDAKQSAPPWAPAGRARIPGAWRGGDTRE